MREFPGICEWQAFTGVTLTSMEESIDHSVEWNRWFEDKVNTSIAAVQRGEITSDHDVRDWLEKRERAEAI